MLLVVIVVWMMIIMMMMMVMMMMIIMVSAKAIVPQYLEVVPPKRIQRLPIRLFRQLLVDTQILT